MNLSNIRAPKKATEKRKRVGRGMGSGMGKTSTRGHKGQRSRSGSRMMRGFEGGQMPLIRRLPKRGFNNAAFHKNYAIVNLSDLNEFKAGTVVNEQLLRESNLVRGHFAGIKILGEGELKHDLEVQADKISASAREKIEKAGGTVTLREARRIEKSQADVGSSQAAPDAATDKPRVKKTKSRNKKSE